MNNKTYGLFIPKKNVPGVGTAFVKKPSVFDEDSNSDEESNVDWVKKSFQKEPYGGGSLTRQAKSDIQKVLADDPTAYQYDEVYDELQKNINDSLVAKKKDRKPKYIQKLMETAERRKRENERRLARQIQKERDAEGDEFADKEVFVTPSYQKKLEEMKKMDEQDKHTEMLEDIGDVMKQRDMTGFYRHMYRVTVTKEDLREPAGTSAQKESNKQPAEDASKEPSKPAQPRQYRKRKSSESSESEPEQSAEVSVAEADNPRSNPDADSDSSDSEKNQSEHSKNPDKDETENKPDHVTADKDDESKNDAYNPDESKENDEENQEESKPKRSIWEKRTVGEILDFALERYYQRKAERLAAKGS